MSFFRFLMLSFMILVNLILPEAIFAAPNSMIHWGIPSAKNQEIPDPGEQLRTIMKKHNALYMGDANSKSLYLTFDCGYENGQTGKILDVLKEKKVSATFFVTGHFVKNEPKLLLRMAKEGHIIGNHTWHHPNLTIVNEIRFEKELEMLRQEVETITGVKRLSYMRPPEGIFSEKTLALGNKLGYTHVFWSAAYKDWDVAHPKGSQYAYNQITKRIHPGAIILLHSIASDNAQALSSVIDEVHKQGYTFKSLDDLMFDLNAPKFIK